MDYLTPTADVSRAFKFDTMSPLPNLNMVGEDGVDHINMAEDGQTELGRDLSHGARIPFVHNYYGQFNTMNNFWYYIRSVERDDRLRTFYGKRLKTFVENTSHCRIPNFRLIVMDANWQKICQTPKLLENIKNSTLPFDFWYRYRRADGIRIRPNFAHWLIAGFEEIRKALKENRDPDFGFLRDNNAEDVFALADQASRDAYSLTHTNA